MTGLLARLVMALRLAMLVPVARHLRMRLDDQWLDVQCKTANRVATERQRERARMYGEVFALTGRHAVGWPCRYLDEFAVAAESVPWPLVLQRRQPWRIRRATRQEQLDEVTDDEENVLERQIDHHTVAVNGGGFRGV